MLGDIFCRDSKKEDISYDNNINAKRKYKFYRFLIFNLNNITVDLYRFLLLSKEFNGQEYSIHQDNAIKCKSRIVSHCAYFPVQTSRMPFLITSPIICEA